MTVENSYEYTRLQELGKSSFEVADGQQDVRGWTVKNDQGKQIGKVRELLFDTHSRKVRYLVIDLKSNDMGLSSREILVPIGLAEVDEHDDFLILPSVSNSILNTLPDYREGNVNPGVENMIRLAFAGADHEAEEGTGLTGAAHTDSAFYDHDHFRESKLYSRRSETKHGAQTVIGVFDDALEAENAVSQLLKEGFGEENIDVSAGKLTESLSAAELENDLEAPANRGTMVTVKVSDSEKGLRASEILDENGAVKVD